MKTEPMHPGEYVKRHVLPEKMNVTAAAARLGISRPAMSNFLNGKADLSADMAARLESAFGVSARKLLDVQSDWDAASRTAPDFSATVKTYVPPFLQLKAANIEEWADTGLSPRQRLSVFLRTLVNSTGLGLSTVDFPGNDDSQRPGWDGMVDAAIATPWIPQGKSGWEFGVDIKIKGKADGDFSKSVDAIEAADRKSTTFVFVTPRRWSSKDAWVKERRAEGLWKDVRVYDASDLEQWLETSISAQAWFANETGQAAQGAYSLDEAFKRWSADCEPRLTDTLFAPAIESYRTTLVRKLAEDAPTPTVISADSRDEALGFLSAAFAAGDENLGKYRDRIIVFSEAGALSRLASQVSNFIPVIMSRDVEKEFAPFRTSMPSFIIYPRNATTTDADVALETLGYEAFNKALETMGLEKDRIDQLSRETGRSPTVLRRRLSSLKAIQTPDWAADPLNASGLIPFMFAGAWKSDNTADRAIMEMLSNDISLDALEKQHSHLLTLDGAPVWSAGLFRGVVSKIDVLFAIKDAMTAADLRRFFDVAELVLSEEDPALDLPEDDRWAANIYGKTREISGALRDGLAETLVLLSVYGPGLFKSRLGFDPEVEAIRLVEKLLSPLSARTLESQVGNLPLYSEAAPETFLSLLETDLQGADPATLKLMRPMSSSMFGSSPRTGVLWALENLAWNEELFMRTVLVLGRLAGQAIDDNLVNKPSGSLSSIFRSWMPQTSAPLDTRKAALSKLAKTYPSVAWPICVDQFSLHRGMGNFAHKPRWRPDGHGKGNVTSGREANEFALHAFRLALGWPEHSRTTIHDLIQNLSELGEVEASEVWDLVDRWADAANDDDKAWLREEIRVSTQTRRARRQRDENQGETETARRAKETFDRLKPTNPILLHRWLFKQAWVEESADEILKPDYDFQKRDERIANLRTEAVKAVLDFGGMPAILQLARSGEASHNVGWFLATVLSDAKLITNAINEIVCATDDDAVRDNLISGALLKSSQDGAQALRHLIAEHDPSMALRLLLLAPFNEDSWALLRGLDAEKQTKYWSEITPGWNRDAEDLTYAVRNLIDVGRPRAAFQFAHFDLKALPPRLLFDLLTAIATKSLEPAKTYMLDRYYLREAFDVLNSSGQMNTDEMAGLEFLYVDVFDEDEHRLVNLEKRVAENPGWFVQAVVFAFKRTDDGQDPPEFAAPNDEARSSRASASYRLLQKLTEIPGSRDGEISASRLGIWIEEVRTGCIEMARRDIGDQCIGKLLSHAPADDDGVWPCVPVREVLEKVMTEHIATGIRVALFNSRGAHFRGEGGGEERTIAAKYAGWARSMEISYPRVAGMLRAMEKSYLRDAEWEDNDAKISRRMRV